MLAASDGQRALQLGIVLGPRLAPRPPSTASGGAVSGALNVYAVRGIGKQQHAQLQARLFRGHPGVFKIAVALLLHELRLHHVGVRRLACLLPLGGQLRKISRLLARLLGHRQLVVRRQRAVEQAGHRGHQPAPRNLLLRAGHRRHGVGTPHGRHRPQPQRFVHNPWLKYSLTPLLAMNFGRSGVSDICPTWPCAPLGSV